MQLGSVLTAAVVACVVAQQATAADPRPLQDRFALFGVALQGATRTPQPAVQPKGLWPNPADTRNPQDTDSTVGGPDSASQLQASGLAVTRRFVDARYTFSGFMATPLVGKVMLMLLGRSGHPSAQQGQGATTNTRARWNLGQDTHLVISRGGSETSASPPQPKICRQNKLHTSPGLAWSVGLVFNDRKGFWRVWAQACAADGQASQERKP